MVEWLFDEQESNVLISEVDRRQVLEVIKDWSDGYLVVLVGVFF
jgi:hypothetical protein